MGEIFVGYRSCWDTRYTSYTAAEANKQNEATAYCPCSGQQNTGKRAVRLISQHNKNERLTIFNLLCLFSVFFDLFWVNSTRIYDL